MFFIFHENDSFENPFGRICNPAALNRGICNPSPFALSDISITVLFDFILFRIKDNDK